MARLLVAADLSSLAQRTLAERLAVTAQAHGHEAIVVQDAPLTACKDADAAICLLDGLAPGGLPVAIAATAHALNLPTLALHTQALPDSLASLFTQAVAVTREQDFAAALPAFYAQVRPFAGKLVRDQVPRIVREAGHHVQFREAAPDERARYLKRKVADEAAELLEADPGAEREEVADLLEALEALLRVRGFDRGDLKLVKEAKRKRRGGFERFLIVESASTVTAPTPPALPDPDARFGSEPFALSPPPAATAWPSEEPVRRDPVVEEPETAFTFPNIEEEPVSAAALEPEREPAPEPEVALPSWLGIEATPTNSPVAAAPTPFPPPTHVAPPAPVSHFHPAPPAPSPADTFQVPSWLSAAPIPAANPPPAPSPTPAPTTTYEPEPLPFQAPTIPSFRPEKPAPLPPGRRANLWNLGSKGEPQEIPEVYDDPDRVQPHIREI